MMDSLDILTNIIIQEYFFMTGCLIIVTDPGNVFRYNGDKPVIHIQLEDSYIHSDIFIHYLGCQGIIMKTNNPVSNFQNLENEIKVAKDRFNNRKFLLLPGNKLEENISDILTTDEIKFVADLNVLEQNFISDKEYLFVIWTHSYIGNDNNNQVVLDKWFPMNRSFLYKNNLYPNKLVNQMGRILRMATFYYEPYSVIGKYSQYLIDRLIDIG